MTCLLLADHTDTVAVVEPLIVTDKELVVEGESGGAGLVGGLAEVTLDVTVAVEGIGVDSVSQTVGGTVVVVSRVLYGVCGGVEHVLVAVWVGVGPDHTLVADASSLCVVVDGSHWAGVHLGDPEVAVDVLGAVVGMEVHAVAVVVLCAVVVHVDRVDVGGGVVVAVWHVGVVVTHTEVGVVHGGGGAGHHVGDTVGAADVLAAVIGVGVGAGGPVVLGAVVDGIGLFSVGVIFLLVMDDVVVLHVNDPVVVVLVMVVVGVLHWVLVVNTGGVGERHQGEADCDLAQHDVR